MVLVGAVAALGAALVAMMITTQLRTANGRMALTQQLFDVDGPSRRDPSKAAWNKAGEVMMSLALRAVAACACGL